MLQLVHYLLAGNTRCLNLLPYSCLLNFKMEFIGTKMGVPLFEDNFGLQYNERHDGFWRWRAAVTGTRWAQSSQESGMGQKTFWTAWGGQAPKGSVDGGVGA